MIKREDIKRAVRIFQKWDNERIWQKPGEAFKHHTLRKSENAIKTAQIIVQVMEDKKIREILGIEEYDGTLWIINASYYRIFFLAQYLLALDGKKLPEGTEDTHKTVELALLYYYIIKGSGLEGKKDIQWKDIQRSRLSNALELLEQAKEETEEVTQQKAKRAVEYMDAERRKRHDFTYGMTVDAELEKAKVSLGRAMEFGDIIKQYIKVKNLK
jgi:hypothetical protein